MKQVQIPFLIYIDAIAIAVVLKTDTDAAFACAFKRYPKARDIFIGAVKTDDVFAVLSAILSELKLVAPLADGAFQLSLSSGPGIRPDPSQPATWPNDGRAEVTHVANGKVFVRYFCRHPGLTSFIPTN